MEDALDLLLQPPDAGSPSIWSDMESEALKLIRTEGQLSASTQGACVRLIKEYNLRAVQIVDSSSGRHDALEALQKAEVLTASECCPPTLKLPLTALTWCNIGCYYRKAGKLQAALTYLRKAASIEEQGWLEGCETYSNPASTHINLCAVLGALGRHADALETIRKAISFASSCGPTSPNADSGGAAAASSPTTNLLVIAHINEALELEHLGRRKEASTAYQAGMRAAGRCSSTESGQLLATCQKFFQHYQARGGGGDQRRPRSAQCSSNAATPRSTTPSAGGGSKAGASLLSRPKSGQSNTSHITRPSTLCSRPTTAGQRAPCTVAGTCGAPKGGSNSPYSSGNRLAGPAQPRLRWSYDTCATS